jgi:nucleotide-binding universal stress UspA family protein
MLSNPSGVDRDTVAAARSRLAEMCNVSPEDDSARIVLGEPGVAIVSLAEELPASLVVVASHGRTGFKRLILGSVAAHVAREAACSVLIVRLAAT